MARRPWRKVVVGFPASAGAIALVWLLVPRPPEVDVASVVRGPLQVTVDDDGKTRIRERYVLAAPLAGRMTRIKLHAGDEVVAGKTLVAELEPADPSLLDERDRTEAEARVKAAETAGLRARAHLEAAREALALATHEYERAAQLRVTGSISQQDFDAAEQRQRIAREEANAAEFSGSIAAYELEVARAALLRTRPWSSSAPDDWRFDLLAPIDGRVLRVFQESATVVTPGMRLMEFGDPTDLEVEIEVLSTDAVKISPEAPVWIEHWGGSQPLKARVRLIEPAAFIKVSALGVEEQRVIVLATFIDPYEKRARLGDAFRVDARIVIWEAADIVKVAAGALFRDAGGWAVFLVQRGRATKTPVEIGQSNGLEAEVVRGLQPGDEVILNPTDRVSNGSRVRARR